MGIGPEVTARALVELQGTAQFTVMGSTAAIGPWLSDVGLSWSSGQVGEDSTDLVLVETGAGRRPAVVEAIAQAAQAVALGQADAMVTGPIHKARLRQEGFEFMGHTDMLGAHFNVDPVMAFTGGRMRVALVTTHIPLHEVQAAITMERVLHTVRTAHAALVRDLGLSAPRLVMCGLNPHAGESGELGRTERDTLLPAADRLRQEGIPILGPLCAEAAFMAAARGENDMVVAMYHDQGLVPLKVVDFGRSVNWTLGLPIIRTSVDHGTADALVGTGRADASSMVAALKLAIQVSERRASI